MRIQAPGQHDSDFSRCQRRIAHDILGEVNRTVSNDDDSDVIECVPGFREMKRLAAFGRFDREVAAGIGCRALARAADGHDDSSDPVRSSRVVDIAGDESGLAEESTDQIAGSEHRQTEQTERENENCLFHRVPPIFSIQTLMRLNIVEV